VSPPSGAARKSTRVSHPHLVGADLVSTYATKSLRFGDHADQLIYVPRFVRLPGAASSSVA
jgi:hypothetical protein